MCCLVCISRIGSPPTYIFSHSISFTPFQVPWPLSFFRFHCLRSPRPPLPSRSLPVLLKPACIPCHLRGIQLYDDGLCHAYKIQNAKRKMPAPKYCAKPQTLLRIEQTKEAHIPFKCHVISTQSHEASGSSFGEEFVKRICIALAPNVLISITTLAYCYMHISHTNNTT